MRILPGHFHEVPLRILVIGCGSSGKRHISNLMMLNVGKILAFDVRDDRRSQAKSQYEIDVLDNLEDAWGHEPDVALIAAPTNLHVPLALQAARHGCHLFIEKPLSHTLDRVDLLYAEVEQLKLVTMVACNMRFHPGPATVKKLIEEGAVGQIVAARIQTGSYLPRWRPGQDYRQSYSASPEWGGAILDCIHEIDLALWYLGPAKVIAAAHVPARSIGLETDGLAEIMLGHESGVLTSVHLNFLQRDYHRTCQIIGSEGTIYWDYADRHVRVYGAGGELKHVCPEPAGWQVNQMYLDELEDFVGAVEKGAPTVNPISRSLAALEVALAARRMGSEGRS